MGFLGRWLQQAIRLALSLVLALLAMQLPAMTHQYAAALVQVAEGQRRDIEQRKASARQFYPAAGETDDAVIQALQPVEPSNAQALQASVARTRALTESYDRIESAPLLLRPVTAALDLARDAGDGGKRAVLATTLDTYAPQLLFRADAAIYGLGGLAIGSLLAEAAIAIATALVRAGRFGRTKPAAGHYPPL